MASPAVPLVEPMNCLYGCMSTADKYGNTIITFANEGVSFEVFRRALLTVAYPRKAIVLVNPPTDCIEEYNRQQQQQQQQDSERTKALFFLTRGDGAKMYTIRNDSRFPELVRGRIESGSASIVVIDPQGNPFVLVHKDPSKPFATSPGGTMEVRELGAEPVDSRLRASVAVREVLEETAGIVGVDGERIEIAGLDLSGRMPVPLYELDYDTQLFGEKVPDTGNIFGYCIRLSGGDDDPPYLRLLFSPNNFRPTEGIFKLEYPDSKANPETSWVCAVPMSTWMRYENLCKDVLHIMKYRRNLCGATLSVWTIVCAYVTYALHNGKTTDLAAVQGLLPFLPKTIIAIRSIDASVG